MNNRFDWTILEAINNAVRAVKAAPLVLGGVAGSGGGGGGPTGGFVGQLPQTRVSYDLSELASSGIPVSGISLLDNLNHIRFRLDAVETGGGGGSPLSVEDEGVEISSAVTVLNFVGGGVNAYETTPGNVTIDISSGGGGGGDYTESDVEPASGIAGDRWFNTASGILFTYVDDINSSQWVELSPGGMGGGGGTGSITVQDSLTTVDNVTLITFSGAVVTDEGSGEALVTISGGGSNPLECVYASYKTAAGQTITSGALTIIDFEAVVEDTDSAVTTGATWKFTAPTAGLYQVSFRITLRNSGNWAAGDGVDFRLYKGGVSTYELDRKPAIANLYITGCGSCTIRLAAGEYINIEINAQAAAGTITLIANAVYNSIEIIRVGS